MSLPTRSLSLLLVALLAAAACRHLPAPGELPAGVACPALRRVALPVVFEPGASPADDAPRFLHRAAWGELALRDDRLSVELRASMLEDAAGRAPTSARRVVELVPVGGTLSSARGRDELAARAHVYDGADPGRARTGLPLYGAVRAEGVWPDVAMELGAERGRLAFRVDVGPDVALERLLWEVRGAGGLRVDGRGALRVEVEGGELRLAPPRFRARGGAAGSRRLAGAYRLDGTRFGFRCERRAPGERLEIDPTVEFVSYLAGALTGPDAVLAVDGADVVYHCERWSQDPFVESDVGGDVVVRALDVTDLDAPTLLFQTALDGVLALKDAEAGFGRLLLGGHTSGLTLPEVEGGFQTDGVDGVTKIVLLSLDAADGTVQHATYLGEPAPPPGPSIRYRLGGVAMLEEEGELVVAAGGSVLVSGPSPGDPPIEYHGPGDASPTAYAGGADDVCFARFSADLSTLETLHFAGGTHREWLRDLEAAPGGFVGAGTTISSEFPTTPGAFQEIPNAGLELGSGPGGSDLCVMRWDADGALTWSTLLGGPSSDSPRALSVDVNGEPIVCFTVLGATYPAATARLSGDGTALESVAPLLDGLGTSGVVDGSESLGSLPGAAGWTAFVATLHAGVGVDVSPNAFDPVSQDMEVYYAQLGPEGQVAYSSFLGGGSDERQYAMAVGADGGVWIGGYTMSSDFPAAIGAPAGTANPSGLESFLVKVAGEALPGTLDKSDGVDPVPTDAPVYFTLELTNEGQETTPPSFLVDDLPAGWELAFLPPDASEDQGSVTLPVPPLAPGETFTATVTAVAPPDAGSYVDLVTWTSDGLVHAQATETTTVLDAADLPELLVEVEGPLVSAPGAQQLYRLAVRNVGPGLAPGVALTGETSSIKDLRFVSAGEPSAAVEAESVLWALGELPSGEEVALDVLATTGAQPGPATLTARATTSLLPGTSAEAAHTTTILGAVADLAIEALEPGQSGELVLRPFLVSEVGGGAATLGPVNVLLEFTAALSATERAATNLVAPGPVQPALPIAVDPGEDRWALSVNLHPAAGLPQVVTWKLPATVSPSEWTARVHAPAVSDPAPENDALSGP